MPIWPNVRRIYNAIAGQGIVDPGPADLVGPIQTVQTVDDVSHTVPPVLVPFISTTIGVGAPGAGRNAGFIIQGGSSGCLWIGQSASATLLTQAFTVSDRSLLANVTPSVPGVQFGPAFGSVYAGFDIATGSIPANFVVVRMTAATQTMAWFIPAGQILCVVHPTANTAMTVYITAQEPLA